MRSKPKLTEEEKREHKKENNYHWKKMHLNYQQEWRAKNSNKVRAYHRKENNCYVLDKKYPELPFIQKDKQKKEGKLMKGPC